MIREVQITVLVDDRVDDPDVTVVLRINGQHVTDVTVGAEAWREVTAPARALLGEPADQALTAVEISIREAVIARAKTGADTQRRRTDAAKAWAAALPAPPSSGAA